MSETPSGDIVTTHPRATLLTTFSAVLEAIAQLIKDEDYRKIGVIIAPFLALVLMIALKTLFKNDKCKKLIKMHESWIASLEQEKQNSNTTPGRRKEIIKEIAGYKVEIKKLQKDSVDIKFT